MGGFQFLCLTCKGKRLPENFWPIEELVGCQEVVGEHDTPWKTA